MCQELSILYIEHEIAENVQRRWTKRIDGFENLTYYQRLKDLDLFSVGTATCTGTTNHVCREVSIMN